MKLEKGLYEQIINNEITKIDKSGLLLNQDNIDKTKATKLFSAYLTRILENGLNIIKNKYDNDALSKQLDFCNVLINKVIELTGDNSFKDKIIDQSAQILNYVSDKDEDTIKERPVTSLIEPTLFTGAKTDLQLLSELKKEIETADEINLIVSFVRWTGLTRLMSSLKDFTNKPGHKLRIITTVYMGATEAKAIEVLNQLPNTQVKISYNTDKTRLHVKSYIFKRNTGFSTAYVGSSNISETALTYGTEWNLKITEYELKDIYKKMTGTFEAYWNDSEYELYTEKDYDRLVSTLKINHFDGRLYHKPFEVAQNKKEYRPYNYQKEVLDKIQVERKLRNIKKNLIVAATGTGKTVIAAFDFKRYVQEHKGKKIRFMFVVHREEILEQSRKCFREILGNDSFGQIMASGKEPDSYDELFVTIQTFHSKKLYNIIDSDFYDYIIVDETHHSAAPMYQELFSHFTPDILLGLTATPFRLDGKSIFEYFDNHITADIRLAEAIDKGLLCPFSYYGIADGTDLTKVKWVRGTYDVDQLNKLYKDEKRLNIIEESLDKYLNDINQVKGLGFCVCKDHANFMADAFNKIGIPSISLNSDSSKQERHEAKARLINGAIKFIFVVDLYNEGVDIPEVNTILFLRPTESATIFIQQLGRGLRLSENKDSLTVLDYVGLANKNYKYVDKYKALLGTDNPNVVSAVKNGFLNVPQGCYIELEEKVKEDVLKNIRQICNVATLKNRYNDFALDNKNASYVEFLDYLDLDPKTLYLYTTFTKLKNPKIEEIKGMQNLLIKLVSIDSPIFIEVLLRTLPLIKNKSLISIEDEFTRRILLMLFYSRYQKSVASLGYKSVVDAIYDLINNDYYEEIICALKYAYGKINKETKLLNPIDNICPLEIHASYSKDQIFAAMGLLTENKYNNERAGVRYIKEDKTDVFLVTLNKNTDEFKGTLFDDYPLGEKLFQWQSQDKTAVESDTGQRYINHKKKGTKMLLCVREMKHSFNQKITDNFIVLGYVDYVSHHGSKPITFTFSLEDEIPIKLQKYIPKSGQ